MNNSEINNFFHKLTGVYECLEDEISKETLLMRLNYNVSGDLKYCWDMAQLVPGFKNNEQIQYFKTLYSKCKDILEANGNIILYGAGDYGQEWVKLRSTFPWSCVCDGDKEKQKTTFFGYTVISPEELVNKHKDEYVFIGALKYAQEIIEQLIAKGYPKDHIIECDRFFKLEILDTQYFDEEIMKPAKNEIFIDGGSFNLDTSIQFQKWCDNSYENIYAFEPDINNYNNCKKVLIERTLDNVELFQAGLWSHNTKLRFDAKGTSGSSLDGKGENTVNVVSIDELLQGNRASFIKMDIEGAELEALEGARKTILEYRPKLAICLYHKPEDIIEIPMYLKSLIPDYKLYIRHYSNMGIETVLYAI